MVELRIKIINTVIIQIGITSNTEVLFLYFFLTWWHLAALYKMVQFSNYVCVHILWRI